MLYGMDRAVLNMFYTMNQADISQISNRLRISTHYAQQICECLVEAGYLERIGRSEYRRIAGKIDRGKPKLKSTDHFVRH